KMGLAVLLDAVCEGLDAPVLDPAYRATTAFDHALVLFHKRVDLLRGEVLPGKKYMFVESHSLAFLLRFLPDQRLKPQRLLFAGESLAEERRVQDGRERRHGRRKPSASQRVSFTRPSVQPPAGTGRLGRL